MGFAEHLKASEDAIKATRERVRIGAATNPNDVARAMANGIVLDSIAINFHRNRLLNTRPDSSRGEGPADVVERLVSETGIGNCGEMAYIAFNQLRWSTHPVSRVALLTSTDMNHSFVVVGGPILRGGQDVVLEAQAAPKDWGDDTVICDPWYKQQGISVPVKNTSVWSRWIEQVVLVTRGKTNNQIAEMKFRCTVHETH